MIEQRLSITGMSCAACVSRVESALRSLPGVEGVSVNLATNEATVAYDATTVVIDDLVASVESAGYGLALQITSLGIEGMSCAACVGRVQSALENVSGVHSVSVNLATNEATIEHLSVPQDNLVQAVEHAGYAVGTASDSGQDQNEHLTGRLLVSVAISITLMVLGTQTVHAHLSPALLHPLMLILTLPAQFWCGWPFLSGFLSALRHGSANMNSLIAVGTLSAFGYSLAITIRGLINGATGSEHLYFDTATMIISFVLLGRLLEHRARNRTSDAIRALIDLQPETARVLRDGTPTVVPVAQVLVGDQIQVRPGDRVPVDGRILEGQSSVDESLISGESMPVGKQSRDSVTGGSINTTGSFTFEATGVGSDTVIARIIDLVKQAQSSRPPIQRLADRIAAVFVPIIFSIASLTFIAWWFTTADLSVAMINAVAVLIISCPCALGLATPTAILVGTGKGAELGLLIKSGEVIETAHQIRTVVLDKTGTLTHGRPVVTDIIPAVDGQSEEVLYYAAAVERNSEHPIGQAITREAERRKVTVKDPQAFVAVAGGGIRGNVDGKEVRLGTERFLSAEGFAFDATEADSLRSEGKTAILVAVDSVHVGTIAVADEIKAGAAEVIRDLKRAGMEVAMLTGDSLLTAEAVGRSVGLDLIVAEVLPEDKSNRIVALQQDRGVVAMVGDGINDAPALAQSDVGIAIGTGTDVAIESADVALMSGDLEGIVALIRLSRRTMRIIRQNLFWAFAYNLVLVPVAALGLLTPWGGPMLAAAAMASSSVTVVSNALRLKRFSP
jgi:P-type Cu+ transporter